MKFAPVLVLLVLTSSCSFSLQKTGVEDSAEESTGGQEPTSSSSVDYATVRKQILQPNCLSCHGREEPILLTYDQVKANLADIERVVLSSKTMPKSGPLSATKQSLLRAWIDDGAPEEVAVKPTPSPSASSSPVSSVGPSRPVAFSVLKEQVLDVSCNSCHYAGNAEGLTSLQSYSDVMEVAGSLWGFTILEGSMPPADEPGVEPLTSEQKDLISLWFSDGMKEE